MMDPTTIKRGDKFTWQNRTVVCTQTDSDTRCGPVFSDPETGHDVLRVDRGEFAQFDCYFTAIDEGVDDIE